LREREREGEGEGGRERVRMREVQHGLATKTRVGDFALLLGWRWWLLNAPSCSESQSPSRRKIGFPRFWRGEKQKPKINSSTVT